MRDIKNGRTPYNDLVITPRPKGRAVENRKQQAFNHIGTDGQHCVVRGSQFINNAFHLILILLFSMFCMLLLSAKAAYANDIVYSTEGGTWTKVNETTWTMDKDDDGITDVILEKEENVWKYKFIVPDPNAAYYAWEETVPSGYEVTGAGTRSNPASSLSVKYSHTPNITDDGIQNGDYENNLSLNDVVTIPGASSLHVKLKYAGESENYDYVCVWEGNHPNYTAYNNNSSALSINGKKKFGGTTGTTIEFDVTGDTATFGYRSDSSGCGNGYGYYAEITGSCGDLKITNRSTEETPVQHGDISLKKEVSGSGIDQNAVYQFEINLDTTDSTTYQLIEGSTKFGDVFFENGKGFVALKAGESANITGLPAGVSYTITEMNSDGYTVDWRGNGAEQVNGTVVSGTVKANMESDVICTNTKKNPLQPGVTGDGTSSLKLINTVENPINSNDNFVFHIAFWNLTPNTEYKYSRDNMPDYYFTAYSSGMADLITNLSANTYINFERLPVGCKYKIAEEANDYVSSYEVTGIIPVQQKGKNIEPNKSLSTAKETGEDNKQTVVEFKNVSDNTQKELDDLVNITVNKTWEDNENALNLRPDSITVHLTQNGDIVATAVLDESNSWKADFLNMDKYLEDGVTKCEYGVVEVNVPGYQSSITKKDATSSTEGGTTVSAHTQSFTITNTLIDTGNLKISKTVYNKDGSEIVGNSEFAKQDFAFTLTIMKDNKPLSGVFDLDGEAGDKTGTIVTDENGQTSFKLKHGECIVIKNLPAGATWTIDEMVSKGYTEANNGTYSGKIEASKTSIAEVKNTYNPSHKLTVTKTVKGNQGDKTKQFRFQMTVSGNNIPSTLSYIKNGIEGTVTVKNKVAEFTLGHKDEIIFTEMPSGAGYTITEPDAANDGYEITCKNESGTIDGDINVSFVNTKNVGVPTGAMTNTVTVFFIVLISVFGIIMIVLKRRNKKH